MEDKDRATQDFGIDWKEHTVLSYFLLVPLFLFRRVIADVNCIGCGVWEVVFLFVFGRLDCPDEDVDCIGRGVREV
jgi:hypothetical protein